MSVPTGCEAVRIVLDGERRRPRGEPEHRVQRMLVRVADDAPRLGIELFEVGERLADTLDDLQIEGAASVAVGG